MSSPVPLWPIASLSASVPSTIAAVLTNHPGLFAVLAAGSLIPGVLKMVLDHRLQLEESRRRFRLQVDRDRLQFEYDHAALAKVPAEQVTELSSVQHGLQATVLPKQGVLSDVSAVPVPAPR